MPLTLHFIILYLLAQIEEPTSKQLYKLYILDSFVQIEETLIAINLLQHCMEKQFPAGRLARRPAGFFNTVGRLARRPKAISAIFLDKLFFHTI